MDSPFNVQIGGAERSTMLFVFVFLLSLVDCTSSVLFLPYMGLYRDVYLNSYLVGEGMSGFIPSIAALAQVYIQGCRFPHPLSLFPNVMYLCAKIRVLFYDEGNDL